ncbi:hypothetical protein AOQ84DRAFT_423973 [Glonium stellatum]|uniref:Uncharacterized protein n=1 Tax=Glonium stellatum TaxID=574774 RepID=A0A8E2JW54_9PEZI|nr:hypothetical protein AOQ84DRAFT_423973 [Glonium stellatum]
MATCVIHGQTDLFGLGVRIGYYLQWISMVVEEVYLRPEMQSVRVSLALFTSASFLALSIQVINTDIDPSLVYITLLLTFGYFFRLVPDIVWNTLKQYREEWRRESDASIFKRKKNPNKLFEDLWLFLLIIVQVFFIYFWGKKVTELNAKECHEYGFLFTKVRLNNPAFRYANLVFSIIILSIIVIAVIVIATELTIYWNKIKDVYSLNSIGQLIPLLIGCVIFLQRLYRIRTKDADLSIKDRLGYFIVL